MTGYLRLFQGYYRFRSVTWN